MNNDLNASDFVHLHAHTEYSKLDGLNHISELVKKLSQDGQRACGITDHGTMSGTAEFEAECKKNGIKPILGIEAYIVEDAQKCILEKDRNRFHITLLAKSRKGFENLCHMTYIANKENFYYKPLFDMKMLEKYNEDVICLDGCNSGFVAQAIDEGDLEKAKSWMKRLKDIFKENFYSEIQFHGCPNANKKWDIQENVNLTKIKLAEELNVENVLTGDFHYLNKEDADIHEIFLCIGTSHYLSDKDRMSLEDFDLHVLTFDEVLDSIKTSDENLYKKYVRAIKNTKVIADSVEDFSIGDGQTHFPVFKIPTNETEQEYLRRLVYEGLSKRYLNRDLKNISQIKLLLDEKIVNKVEYELYTINKLRFNGYFLIVQEFINWGKDRGILFGLGRGSCVASLACYALHITEADPLLQPDLMFERFLNEVRVSLADIDTDIQDDRRQEVIDHIIELYGTESVSLILTLNGMRPKNAFKDVARVLEFPFEKSLQVSKTIPDAVYGGGKEFPKLLEENNEETIEFRKLYNEDEDVKKITDYAMRLENTIRNLGTHACGIVISPEPVWKYMPVERAKNGEIETGYTMHYVEGTTGSIKFDFLGLGNLGIIADTNKQIENNYVEVDGKIKRKSELTEEDKKLDIKKYSPNMYQIKDGDEKVYELFNSGKSKFTFQFGSDFIRNFMKEFKPKDLYELTIVTAIGRPGPMQYMPGFIRRKNGEEQIKCMELFKPVLNQTYGFLTFQEQFMKMATIVGFSGADADNARKALAKKNLIIMADIKEKFFKGAMDRGESEKDLEQFWSELQDYASYSFNQSHAYAYAYLGYITCWYLVHYTSEYMAATMNKISGDKDKLKEAISFSKEMDVKVLPPNVLQSGENFTAGKDRKEIFYGLSGIKNVGSSVGPLIDIIRKRNPETLADFLIIAKPYLNSRKLEFLIKAGALDCFEYKRSILVYNLEKIKDWYGKIKVTKSKKQEEVPPMLKQLGFDGLSDIKPKEEFPKLETPEKVDIISLLKTERDCLGDFVTAHPASLYEERNKDFFYKDIKELEGRVFTKCCGIIIKIKKWQKNSNLIIDCNEVEIEAQCWNDILGHIKVDTVVSFDMKVDSYISKDGTKKYKYSIVRIINNE